MGRALFAAQAADLSMPAQQFVTNLYEGFLQRGPDAGGLSHWTGEAGTTAQSRQNVLNAFAACDPFRELAGTLYREAFWTVSDHLGTSRMIADKSGSLAGVKRHDYLPFGEELYTGSGGRSPSQGYGALDNVRQQFTRYERDDETGLDFAGARYHSSSQGRFLSIDPLLSTGQATDPQTWNRYAYALNNPLYYTDPTGMYVCKGTTAQCAWFGYGLAEARRNLANIEAIYKKDSKEYIKAAAAVSAYGEDETRKKTNNGVIVQFGNPTKGGLGETSVTKDREGKLVGNITVTIRPDVLRSSASDDVIIHEGSHVADGKNKGQINAYQTETDAYMVSSVYTEAAMPDSFSIPPTTDGKTHMLWNPAWKDDPNKQKMRSDAIREFIAVPIRQGGYGLTPPVQRQPRGNPRRRRH
jgi:RHS repeat-associated protein